MSPQHARSTIQNVDVFVIVGVQLLGGFFGDPSARLIEAAHKDHRLTQVLRQTDIRDRNAIDPRVTELADDQL